MSELQDFSQFDLRQIVAQMLEAGDMDAHIAFGKFVELEITINEIRSADGRVQYRRKGYSPPVAFAAEAT